MYSISHFSPYEVCVVQWLSHLVAMQMVPNSIPGGTFFIFFLFFTSFLSEIFLESLATWFLAKNRNWQVKLQLNLQISAKTTYSNVFLSQFPSFSSYLEQRTVRNSRGPFLAMFYLIKQQIFVLKSPKIFSQIIDPQ